VLRARSAAGLSAVTAVLITFACGSGVATAGHVSCGQVITTDTTLDSDLLNCQADGVLIGAGNITLNLNGHTIDGDNGTGDAGVGNYDPAVGTLLRRRDCEERTCPAVRDRRGGG
jgi:hypothetical protein